MLDWLELDLTRPRQRTHTALTEKPSTTYSDAIKMAIKLELVPPVNEFELNIEQTELRALSMRPKIQEADMRVKQLRLERKIIMSEYIPNVSVGVVYITLPGFNNEIIPKNLLLQGSLSIGMRLIGGARLYALKLIPRLNKEPVSLLKAPENKC